jgi:hypothetical protein
MSWTNVSREKRKVVKKQCGKGRLGENMHIVYNAFLKVK